MSPEKTNNFSAARNTFKGVLVRINDGRPDSACPIAARLKGANAEWNPT
jgi:hypothetical protein